MSLPMFGNFHITVYEVPHWLEFCKPFHYVWYSLWQKKNLFPQRSPSFVLWFVVCWTRFHNLCVQILFKIFFHPGFLFFCLPLTWIVFLIGSPTGVQEKGSISEICAKTQKTWGTWCGLFCGKNDVKSWRHSHMPQGSILVGELNLHI